MDVIKDTMLDQLDNINHAIFTRNGGVSTGIYASLNCSYYCEDDPKNVSINRERAITYFSTTINNLVSLNNIHGNDVIIVDKPWLVTKAPLADAMVTSTKNILLGATSADCPIVLFADNENQVIGSAHAGWKGAKMGVLNATVVAMLSLGAKIDNLVACITPCIAQSSYEVDQHFYDLFIAETLSNNKYFSAQNKLKKSYAFDLRSYLAEQLVKLGIKHISHIEIDTYTHEDLFFSYRRALHRKEKDFACNLICLSLK